MAARFLVAAALSPLALAFSNTLPLVSWSSHTGALDFLPSSLSNEINSALLLEKILFNDDVCDHDTIVVIEQPGLHASDLRTLSPHNYLSRTLSSSPSARQYPYVPHQPFDLSSMTKDLSSHCGTLLVNYTPGVGAVSLEHGKKNIVCLNMPHLSGSGKYRKHKMAEHVALLSDELSALGSSFPNYLVIFTGSSHMKRQSPDIDLPTRPVLDISSSNVYINANTTLPEGGILKRYQLLTPGLITGLLVTFFILVPIVMAGINALASIQSPLKSDIPKGFSAQDRKNA